VHLTSQQQRGEGVREIRHASHASIVGDGVTPTEGGKVLFRKNPAIIEQLEKQLGGLARYSSMPTRGGKV
jgi:hypothetical protein